MSGEQNKALVRRFIAASVGDDLAAFKELMAPDFVAHMAGGDQRREAFVQHNGAFTAPFSEREFAVEDQVAEGDKIVTRAAWRATHSGVFQGLPPTGKRIAVSAYLLDRVKDGKVVEHWSLFDVMSMMQQLGVVPPPQPKR